jgi:hypothetical protein
MSRASRRSSNTRWPEPSRADAWAWSTGPVGVRAMVWPVPLCCSVAMEGALLSGLAGRSTGAFPGEAGGGGGLGPW